MSDVMLTTIDNPFSPFDEFDAWYAFDVSSGYNTCAYLGRLVNVSPEQSDADYELAIEQAIDEVIEQNVLGVYKKVQQKDFSNVR